jgi:hypothetical protein
MSHYLQEKAADPSRTTGAFVLPDWPEKPWWKHFSGMKLLRYYPRGTILFTKPASSSTSSSDLPSHATRVRLGPTRWPVVVLWDPPVSTSPTPSLPPLPTSLLPRSRDGTSRDSLFSTLSHASLLNAWEEQGVDSRGMTLHGSLDGRPCNVFLDSGAEGMQGNFISETFAKEMQLKIAPSNTTVTLGDSFSRKVCSRERPAQNTSLRGKRVWAFWCFLGPCAPSLLPA